MSLNSVERKCFASKSVGKYLVVRLKFSSSPLFHRLLPLHKASSLGEVPQRRVNFSRRVPYGGKADSLRRCRLLRANLQ